MKEIQGTSYEDELQLEKIREASKPKKKDPSSILNKKSLSSKEMDEIFLEDEDYLDYEEEF